MNRKRACKMADDEQVWACRTKTGAEFWWYTPLGSWALGPAAKLTWEEALKVVKQCAEGEVEIVQHPGSHQKPFDRKVFEAIIKAELANPPKGIKPDLWSRYLLALLENVLTAKRPEDQNEATFRGSILLIREHPYMLEQAGEGLFIPV